MSLVGLDTLIFSEILSDLLIFLSCLPCLNAFGMMETCLIDFLICNHRPSIGPGYLVKAKRNKQT